MSFSIDNLLYVLVLNALHQIKATKMHPKVNHVQHHLYLTIISLRDVLFGRPRVDTDNLLLGTRRNHALREVLGEILGEALFRKFIT
jgi:hypothetical protein